ncbi:hypothetical protein [Kitasatospora sp. DSM 101779]|uniref:hypothetical protein n=1 Tax=Kitasatospora sp. DSM 101779 TaxID=2853165 RepID=UPI0021D95C15|nr:hypothetical protein [Kitasatospora sp. DSM 101779]MCU7820385.1 hypothetical protein [Kitasatospora sp. DSM 101779]
MSRPRLRTALLAAVLATGAVASAATPAGAAGAPAATTPSAATPLSAPGPFTEPDFAATCAWHRYGEGEQPPWWLMFTDPLCVEYSKRDITVDNGGALRFLLAEPARIAASLLTCHYYQQDHWSVQPSTGAAPWVAWDGQYWWDRTGRRAGVRLTGFRVDGVPVGIGDAVIALRPHHPALADALAAYGTASGESGFTTALPSDLRCALAG